MASERKRNLATIETALKAARKLTRPARYGGLKDLDDALVEALTGIEWLRNYPDSLFDEFAKLENYRWPDNGIPLGRAWAKEIVDTFKRGFADLRTKETKL